MKKLQVLLLTAAVVAAHAQPAIRMTIGPHWTQTSLPPSVWNGLASSSDGTVLVACASGGVYASRDKGATWTRTTLATMAGDLNISWSCVAVSSDGTRVVVARTKNTACVGGVFISQDSGISWTQSDAPNENWTAVVSSADGKKAAAACGTGIYISTNFGLNWTRTSALNRDWISIASSSDGKTIVAGTVEWSGAIAAGSIYRSSDYGLTWTLTSAPDRVWHSVASSSDGSRMVAMGRMNTLDFNTIRSADGVYVSIDSGSHWELTSAPIEVYWGSVACSTDGKTMVASLRQTFVNGESGSGEVFASRDSGTTWWELTSAPRQPAIAPQYRGVYWGPVAVSADGSRVVGADNAGGWVYLARVPAAPMNLAEAARLDYSNLATGIKYQLETSQDLRSWTSVAAGWFYGSSNTISQCVEVTGERSRFFRLRQ
jgi:hypothetical protein